MDNLISKTKGLIKGAPTAVVVSVLIHAGLLLVATGFVVFKYVNKPEAIFVPPVLPERKPLALQKLQIKKQKAAKPSSTRITSTMPRPMVTEFQFPEMTGLGTGIGIGSLEGNLELPSLDDGGTVFGDPVTIGCDFIGTFYDLKRNRRGNKGISISREEYCDAVSEFVNNDWDPVTLSQYYRSPNKLFATTFCIPTIPSSVAPFAFGERNTVGYAWLVHYKGKLVHKDGITFRFWGGADDVLCVRVDGELALVANWVGSGGDDSGSDVGVIGSTWVRNHKNSGRWVMGGSVVMRIGDWITLEPGVPLDMEVIIGEDPGGQFNAMLLVEVKDVEYPRNRTGAPILPVFKTTELSQELIDTIYVDLRPEEVDLIGGPVFRDF